MPWVDLYNTTAGTYGLCCVETQNHNTNIIPISQDLEQHWNSEYIKQIRKQLLNNQQPSQCNACWHNESHGVKSLRQIRNQRYAGDLSNPDYYANLTDKDGTVSIDQITGISMSVDNRCQLRCISCTPSLSTGVAREYAKLGWQDTFKDRKEFPIKISNHGVNVKHSVHYYDTIKKLAPQLTWLSITGGEPMINRDLLELLTWLKDQGYSKKINLLTITNGVKILPGMIDVLKSFQHVVLGVSVDGVDQLDTYLRYPTNWDKKLQHIKLLKTEFKNLYIQTTVYALNVSRILEIVKFVNELEISDHHVNLLANPEVLRVGNLPLNLRARIQQQIFDSPNHKKLQPILNALTTEHSQTDALKQIIQTYDSIRPWALKDIVPELNFY